MLLFCKKYDFCECLMDGWGGRGGIEVFCNKNVVVIEWKNMHLIYSNLAKKRMQETFILTFVVAYFCWIENFNFNT